MVLPLILMFLFISIEFGRAFMVKHCLEAAALDGTRVAIVAGATSSDVDAAVVSPLASAGISNYQVSVTPANLTAAEQWDPVTVSISVPFSNVSWMPMPGYLSNITLQSTCTLPREAEAE
jgi:Flp pilus assembly protein TadG